ncbi:MAG TPA: hypothetical protein DD454_01135 [Candidatus Moranbacteria bacterium]|nr:hypothetical protein [Candidatus Moranbacteria bacterium]
MIIFLFLLDCYCIEKDSASNSSKKALKLTKNRRVFIENCLNGNFWCADFFSLKIGQYGAIV